MELNVKLYQKERDDDDDDDDNDGGENIGIPNAWVLRC
jgi:hypothetical protein